MHIEKLAVDEAQLFSLGNFYQLGPTLNQWAKSAQQLYSGVHNGIRNMTLYYLDQKSTTFKKYRIPSPNNPYFTYEDYIDSIKRYGGEETDLFLQLVLAQPGSAAFSVINRDAMIIAPHPFHSYRYTSTDKAKGKTYRDVLILPKIDKFEQMVLGIDMGFVDPTLIQLFGKDNGRWRAVIRWKVQRIDFPEQEEIIDMIARHYDVQRIAIDIGSGGGGAGVVQSLISRPEFRGGKYESRIVGVNFGDQVTAGADMQGEVLTVPVKTFGAQQIAQMVEMSLLEFSELDTEGISQVERIAKQKTPSGYDKYFIMSDKGTGVSGDDHIFASYICFVMALQVQEVTAIKKLGKASTGTSNK